MWCTYEGMSGWKRPFDVPCVHPAHRSTAGRAGSGLSGRFDGRYVHIVHTWRARELPRVGCTAAPPELDRVAYRPAAMSKHPRGLAAAALVLAVVVAGCQSIPAVASLVPVAGPLATVTVRGGECVNGPCGGTTVIERNGRIHQREPAAAELGRLPDDVLTALDAAVKTTDFDVIRARPFTGECPLAFDGQEYIYEFGAPGGTERIATCETEIDPSHPLFVAMAAALATAQPS
jgi:hypothetical protein